jgi:iron complex transport system ATP-binding protein
VIAAMHDLNLAARYFARLLLFQRGIVADGRPAEVLEPGLLGRVYGVNVQVGILRGAEHLSVLPPSNADAEFEHPDRPKPQVHVIAGGGAGELMMRALADARIPFVAGALNIGDSDHTLALRLANEVITEQPYAPISPEVLQRVRHSLMDVGLLIICAAPIGPGNVALLREALIAAQRGLAILLLVPGIADSVCIPDEPIASSDGLLQRSGMAARDYTGGEGLKLIRELLQAGALIVGSVAEAIETTRRYTASTGRLS